MRAEISPEIPVVESRVFESHAEARFALLTIDVRNDSEVEFRNEFLGAAKLRASTYLASGFVELSQLDEAGTELDSDDQRAAHFVLLERCDDTPHLARVVGNMRLVVKDERGPLPVEVFLPDLFVNERLPLDSVETSRLIASHEDPRIQRLMAWPLFVAGYECVSRLSLGPVYGLVSPALVRVLQKRKVPVVPIWEATHIPAINATKQPVILDLQVFGDLIKSIGDQGAMPAAGYRCAYLESGYRTEGLSA